MYKYVSYNTMEITKELNEIRDQFEKDLTTVIEGTFDQDHSFEVPRRVGTTTLLKQMSERFLLVYEDCRGYEIISNSNGKRIVAGCGDVFKDFIYPLHNKIEHTLLLKRTNLV